MQGNDIAGWEYARIGIIFEGLLGVKPTAAKGLLSKLKRSADAEAEAWVFDDIVYRSLRSLYTKGYQVALEVYTFQGEDFAEQLEHKLGRWHIFANEVLSFENTDELLQYLRGNLAVTTVYTADQDLAAFIGPRAMVRQPATPLGF